MLKDALQQAKERFEKDTAEHQMTIELDDGFHKHLRFAKPGTMIYSYSIVTWPGFLAIAGDVQTLIFTRESDMLTFFERCHGTPDPVYLSGKLSGEFKTKRYSPDAFKREARRWLNERLEEMEADGESENVRDELREAVEHDLVRRAPGFPEEALPMLQDFKAAGQRIQDPWEWDLEEWDAAFLWNLWAIVLGIERYRKVIG
jgi:hypothetical protein